MITDEEISQLPEDPQLAFVEFEKILRARLHQHEDELAQEQYGNPNPYRLEYMNKVIAAASFYDVEGVKDWKIPRSSDNITEACRDFQADVDYFTIQVRLRHSPRTREGSVGLDTDTKSAIHDYITKIRLVIESAGLPTEKQDDLYKCLNHFALAVDKSRTDFQAGMAIYVGVCTGIGDGFKKLEPARRWIDSIAGLLGKAKEAEDKLRQALPKYEGHKQITAPKRELPAPASSDSEPDDEIPF